MRKVLGILIGLFMLAHALVPALPTYVCLAMGGIRMMHSCCPDAADEPQGADDGTVLRDVRCCQFAPAVTIEAQRLPQTTFTAPALPFIAVVVLPEVLPPPWRTPLLRGTARGDPALLGPPLLLHPILRI